MFSWVRVAVLTVIAGHVLGDECDVSDASLLQNFHGELNTAASEAEPKLHNFIEVSTMGGKLRATQSSLLCDAVSYKPSEIEVKFMENAVELTNSKETLCDALGDVAPEWIQLNLAEKVAALDSKIFSRICTKDAKEQVIEPLAGVLRDPRIFCSETAKQVRDPLLYSVDWLVLADNQSFDSAADSKRILFDAGGSNFKDATMFFATKYEERGIELDHIYVWEATHRSVEDYWAGVPEDVREKWEPRLTWYNGVPITAESEDEHNPVHRIRRECGPKDFCAFKLDVDTPAVELPLVQELQKDPGNLKEFFFEHHVGNKLMHPWWKRGVEGNFAKSYALFTALRKKGVRAHSWI